MSPKSKCIGCASSRNRKIQQSRALCSFRLSHTTVMTTASPIKYHKITVPMLLVGYGSIGRGVLPLLERHLEFTKDQLTILAPDTSKFHELRKRGYTKLIEHGLTKENYTGVLEGIFGRPTTDDTALRGIMVNVSCNTCSVDLVRLCRKLKVLYIDTVVEPWGGYYLDPKLTMGARTNYAMRQEMRDERAKAPGQGTTAISCCGANPGMISWLLKEGLLTLHKDLLPGQEVVAPTTREGWAALMQKLGVKGVHIAERDTQISKFRREPNTFVNTWSVEGFVAESFQPAELGWGTHERWFPPNGVRHEEGCQAAIYLKQPGCFTPVRTWVPSMGPQMAFLVTHNESISIADYYTVGDKQHPQFRPTAHYAYHPCDDAVLSLHEMRGSGIEGKKEVLMTEDDIIGGFDELGVLIYGHGKNALWYGTTLRWDELQCKEQSATGLQVTSAVLAGVIWGIENPNVGVVEADEMDWKTMPRYPAPLLGEGVGQVHRLDSASSRAKQHKQALPASHPHKL